MLILLTLIFILLITYLIEQVQKPRNFPPGPPWLPFVGSLPRLKKLSKSLGGQHHALSALAKEYDTNVLGLKLGSEYVITVFSYPVVREILTNEEFEGRPDNFFLRLRCLGKRNGITCTDGELWSSQRNFVNRHLRLLGFGKKTMDKMIQDEATEILSALRINESNVDLHTFFAPSVINVIWSLVTGERIPKDSNQLKELLDLFKLRAKAFDMTGGILSHYPWLRHLLPEWSGYNLIQKVNSSMKNLFMKTIREHHNTWEEGKDDDLIYRYISEMKIKKDAKNFTDHQLVMICVDLFIGGAQTTSATLNFVFLMMVMYPDIQRQVQEDIDKNLRKECTIEYAERHKVPYTEAVLLETMRFRHVLPIIGPRRVLKDTTIEGYNVPKDTTILISLYSIHNNEEYWKNPEMFKPERFLDENGLQIKKEKFIPFGLGRRRCLGEVLSKSFIFVVFVEILRKYNVCLARGSQRPTGKYLSGITLSPEHYSVVFTERTEGL